MKKMTKLALLAICTSLALSACGADDPAPTPTLSYDQIRTLAVSTFASGLTQTAMADPTATSTPLPTDTPFSLSTLPPSGTLPAGFPTAPGGAGTPAGCNSLVYLKDVTIPDNTSMQPGQAFTKTWLVQNLGSCNWTAGFKFSLVGGEAMGGTTLTLTSPVLSGAQTQLSVPMTAPQTGGTFTGMWRMADPNGTFFGDMLTVVIHVGPAGSTPASPAPTATLTPSPTTQP